MPDRTPERGKSPLLKNFIPGLPERGKIKIGEKGAWKQSQQGKQFQAPQKLDHFRITTMERESEQQGGNFCQDLAMHKKFGERPTAIPVILMFDEISLNFQCRMTCYKGKTRWCSGDGEAAFRLKDMAKPEYTTVDCPCERSAFDYKGPEKCKTTGKLSVIIEGAEVVGGVWTFRTTSWNSVQSIYSSLILIKRITGGPLAGIPLTMTVTPKTATTPEGASTKVFIVSLEYRGTPQALRGEGLKVLSEGVEHRARLELMEHQIEEMIAKDMALGGDEGDAEFTEEFYPEQAEAAGPTPPAPQTQPTTEEPQKTTGRGRPRKQAEQTPEQEQTNQAPQYNGLGNGPSPEPTRKQQEATPEQTPFDEPATSTGYVLDGIPAPAPDDDDDMFDVVGKGR